jgi:molecular chaperone GrpE
MSQSADPETENLSDDPQDPSQTASALPESDPFADAQLEIAKWKDMSLRTAAELENYRKRVARENQEARAYASADVLRALLPILDNFEMGLDAARAENEKSMIFQGLSMVRRQLQDFLREFGVDELNPIGKKFDPNLHEAVSQEPSAQQPEGTVLKVMRRGFKLKDRLLRPAMVVVSSGDAPQASSPS